MKTFGWNFQVPFFKSLRGYSCSCDQGGPDFIPLCITTFSRHPVSHMIWLENHEDPDLMSFPRQTKPIRKHGVPQQKPGTPKFWKLGSNRGQDYSFRPFAGWHWPFGLEPVGTNTKLESYGKHNHLQKIPRKYRMVWRNFIRKRCQAKIFTSVFEVKDVMSSSSLQHQKYLPRHSFPQFVSSILTFMNVTVFFKVLHHKTVTICFGSPLALSTPRNLRARKSRSNSVCFLLCQVWRLGIPRGWISREVSFHPRKLTIFFPENQLLEDEFSFWNGSFYGHMLIFRGD